MNQAKFNFKNRHPPRRYQSVNAGVLWPQILAADPEKYPGLMQVIAQRALHRLGKPHCESDCPLCLGQVGQSEPGSQNL
jgi:hypothetical protein